MGIISTALAPYRLYAYAAGAVLIIGLSWYALHTHDAKIRLDERTKVLAEDAKALQVAKDVADKQTKVIQAKADQAEHAHDKELIDLREYQRAHPIGPVWVSNRKSDRIACVPGTSTSNGINASTSASAEPILSMPEGGASQRNIGPVLDLLAARADEVSAQLREWQSR